jgi:hypothetical protein
VFGRRIHADYQEVFIQQDDTRAQGINDIAGVITERAVVVGSAAGRTTGRCLF